MLDKHDNIGFDVEIKRYLAKIDIGAGALTNKALPRAANAGMKVQRVQAFQPAEFDENSGAKPRVDLSIYRVLRAAWRITPDICRRMRYTETVSAVAGR
jgi:hypothetical protein